MEPYAPFYRFLYVETGKTYRWTDRADWDDSKILAHLAQPEVAVCWLQVAGMVAGWCELEHRDDEVQLSYFGLLPPFVGQGWGRFWLDWTLRKAWQPAPRRVWVHTCELDHPAALPLYEKLGFAPYRTEDYQPT